MAPPRDYDDYTGKERAYFHIPAYIRDQLEEEPDMYFRDLFNDLFDSSEDQRGLNWNEAHDAYNDLRRHMDREYNVDIDDFFDWDAWREERKEHGMSA